jgi:hypothetical protein
MADATLKMILLGQDRGASRAIKGVGDQAERTESRTHRLGAAFAKAGKFAALGLAAGAVAGGVALVKMTKGAIEDEAAQKRLATTLKNTAGATRAGVAGVESWISRVGVATGVTDDELRPALDRLVRSTHDVGKAQDLTRLAMDASAGTGKSLESVSNALAKAHDGSTGALGKLGIATKDAAGNALSFDQITKNMAETFKGQATAHANTLEGKMSRLKLVLSETGETIGSKLIPILTNLATWFLEKVVPAVSGFFDKLQSGQGAAGVFKNILEGIGDVVKAVAGWIGDELVPFLKEMVDRFRDAMGGTSGFKDQMDKLKPTIDVVKAALSVLWEGLKIAARVLIPFFVFQFKLAITTIGLLGQAAKWLWDHAFQPALRLITQGIGWLLDGLANMLGALGHIPGFGWAKDAAENLRSAAKQAKEFADNIKDIPKNPKVTVTTVYKNVTSSDGTHGGNTKGHVYKAGAVGTQFATGGRMWVGERGPEMVTLPRGSSLAPAHESARTGGARSTEVVHVLDLRLNGKTLRRMLLDEKRMNGGMDLGLA